MAGVSPRGRAWLMLAVGLPAVLWALVPQAGELAAVELRARSEPGGANSAFELATPAGIARLRALLTVAPDRLDWRRTLANALEDSGRATEAMVQWRLVAGDPDATEADVRAAARELLGHGARTRAWRCSRGWRAAAG